MRKLLPVLIFFFISHNTFSQDSCQLRISLLTCAPGEELYSTFGHTALRVQDEKTGADEVYNYGTFEFGPDFYMQFIRGKLLYFLSVEQFQDFVRQYQYQSRSIREQVLLLNCNERQRLYSALRENAMEENRYYKYDFLFDNCTTRAGNIVASNTDKPVVFKNILPAEIPSFRDLIHSYLDAGQQYWSKLGIDILLGAKLDKKATNREAMFLPDYLLKGFDSATIHHDPLSSLAQTILPMPQVVNERSLFTPGVVFTILFFMVAGLFFIKKKWATQILNIFDFLFFFILGLAGILLLFMWFGTDHKLCQNNYNLCWALPTNSVMAFFVHNRKDWIKKYFRIVFWFTLVLLLTWTFLPQHMNNALLPLVLLIIFRSWHLSKKYRYATERNHT